MSACRFRAALVVLATCFLSFPAVLVERAAAQVPEDIRAALTARGHALLIGVSSYDNDAWPQLLSVITDIEALSLGLAPHFATVETLINPTAEAIRTKLRDFMTGLWDQPDARLIVYYAGHG